LFVRLTVTPYVGGLVHRIVARCSIFWARGRECCRRTLAASLRWAARPQMTTRMPLTARIVMSSCDRAWTVVALGAVLAIIAVVYATQHFAITSDAVDLISPGLPWRQNKAKFDRAFPQLSDLIVVVVDGATPELAEKGAAELSARF